jgi:hypothetical protein
MPIFTILASFCSFAVGWHIGLSWWLIPTLFLAAFAGYGAGTLDER